MTSTLDGSPKVAIVVPAYNCERYIEDAYRSACAQTMQDWEMVIVNDGSSDNTGRICDAIAQSDPRVRVIHQNNSGGPSVPRNIGISNTSAEYISFLDPDDYWFPDKLRRQLEILDAHPQISILFEDSELIDENGSCLGSYFEQLSFQNESASHFQSASPGVHIALPSFFVFASCVYTGIQTSGVMIPRDVLDNLDYWFDPDLKASEDNDLWWRLIDLGDAAYIDEALHAYRKHSGGITDDVAKVTIGRHQSHARNYHRSRHRLNWRSAISYRRRISQECVNRGWGHQNSGQHEDALHWYLQSLYWLASIKGLRGAVASTVRMVFSKKREA